MALTKDVELKLERAGLVVHLTANQTRWHANAQDAYDYTKKGFQGDRVRQDDIAKTLRVVVEIDKPLRAVLDSKRYSQKYWIDYFTALVIDRSWDTLAK